jgi:peptide/nickel transport system substrate-binding protein
MEDQAMSRSADEEGFRKFDRFLEEWSRRDFLKRVGIGTAYAAFLAGGVPALEACLNAGNQTASPTGASKKGGHVTYGTFSDPKQFNSVLTSDDASSHVTARIYDGLLTIDENGTGQQKPLLAESVPKPSADGLSYTFKIRKDVKWTDGKPLTADDVAFTYNIMVDPKYKAANSPRSATVQSFVESVTASDQYTVVFKMKKVYAPFLLQHGTYGILPKSVYGSLTPEQINTTDANTNPQVTSGMFKFDKWEKGQQVTLSRNDNYYRGAPLLDKYVVKNTGSSVAVSNQLKTGEVDIGGIDNSQFDSFATVANVDVKKYTTLSFEFFGYQLDPSKPAGKLFSDKQVRQALVYGLDRQAMVDAIYFKQGVVPDSVIPPPLWAFNPNVKPKYNYDTKKAEQMLDAAGWTKGSDGIRAKAGQRLKFEIITNSGNKTRESLIVAMQDQWKKIGVDATAKPVDFNGVLVPAITNTRNFDIFMVGFGPFTDPDESQLWHSRATNAGGFNGMQFKNARVDKLLDDGVATFDQAKRKQIYAELQDIMADEVPGPILVFAKALVGVNKRVQGTKYSTWGSTTANWFKDVWVSDGK